MVIGRPRRPPVFSVPVRIYAHLSWTCWARLPLIDEPVAAFLQPFLLAEAKRHGARIIEIGVVPNHVHLLLELPPAYDVPRLVQGLKGASARLANRDGHARNESLRWDAGYDLRSVGLKQLPHVANYIRHQELKHGSPKPRVPNQPFRAGVVAEPALQRTDSISTSRVRSLLEI